MRASFIAAAVTVVFWYRVARISRRAARHPRRSCDDRREGCHDPSNPDRMGARRPDQDRQRRTHTRRSGHARAARRARAAGAAGAAAVARRVRDRTAPDDGGKCVGIRPDPGDAGHRPGTVAEQRPVRGRTAAVRGVSATAISAAARRTTTGTTPFHRRRERSSREIGVRCSCSRRLRLAGSLSRRCRRISSRSQACSSGRLPAHSRARQRRLRPWASRFRA